MTIQSLIEQFTEYRELVDDEKQQVELFRALFVEVACTCCGCVGCCVAGWDNAPASQSESV